MPYRLNHINVWTIEDSNGWALVDTGLYTQETMDIWAELIAKPPLSGPLIRVLATHSHPDHLGLAGWLTRKHGVELWVSRGEYLMYRTLLSGKHPPMHCGSIGRRVGAKPQWRVTELASVALRRTSTHFQTASVAWGTGYECRSAGTIWR